MLKPEEVQKLIAALKEKVGKKVKLASHYKVWDRTRGGDTSGQRHEDSEEEIVFLGVYGLGQKPLYVHGIDNEGKVAIFRNDFDVWMDEESGRATHEFRTNMTKIDDVEIGAWFNDRVDRGEEQAFVGKVAVAEPKNNFLAEKILKGKPEYHPPFGRPYYYPSYFKLDSSKFVEKALAYLDRIV